MSLTATHDRTELVETLLLFNADAHTLSRRGRFGTDSEVYADVHQQINLCLEAMGL